MKRICIYTRKLWFILLFLLPCLLAGGCSPGQRADVSIKSYCEAILHQDPAQLSKFHVSHDEFQRAFFRNFMPAFQAEYGYIFTDKQVKRIGNAFLENMKRVPIKTALVSQSGRTAVVKVSVGNFYSPIQPEQILNEALYYQMAYLVMPEDVTEKLTKAAIEQMNNMMVLNYSDFLVDCVYNGETDCWEPEDMELFASDLILAFLGI